MAELETLPNIGTVLASCLHRAGIGSKEELHTLGAERSFERLRAALPENACLSKLNAIAAAVEGMCWHDLSPERRTELAVSKQRKWTTRNARPRPPAHLPLGRTLFEHWLATSERYSSD